MGSRRQHRLRTTLAVARHLAAREQKSLGKVISALARQGLRRSAHSQNSERNEILLLPSRKEAVPVTLELVNQLRDEQP